MAEPAAARKARIHPGVKRLPPAATDPGRPREIELKLRLRAQDLAPLRGRLASRGEGRRQRIDNVYLDTPDRRLAANRAALRLRRIEHGGRSRWVQTLKTEDAAAALSVRGEWETPLRSGAIDLARLADAPLERLLGPQAGAALLGPVFRTVFERTTWQIEAHGARIEAALDLGQIEAGAAAEPICELELELLDGPAGALLALAQELAGATGRRRADLRLLPYGDSKAARGYRLAQGSAPGPLAPPAAPPEQVFEPRMGMALAARHWVATGMPALLANMEGIASSADPEFVRQARVALRRMRSGLDLLAPEDLPPALAGGLKRWTERLGAVRDWDVLCAEQLPALASGVADADARAWPRVIAAAARRQAAARARLRRQLDEPAFAEFALRLLQWSMGTPARAGKRLGEAAPRRLDARLQRLARAARAFARLSEERQHKLRIEAKRLRYALEMLRGVLPRRPWRADQRALARFQRATGAVRDGAQAQAMVGRLTRSAALRAACGGWARTQAQRQVARARRAAALLARSR